MTVHELITYLQDCDKPGAEVKILIHDDDYVTGECDVFDVYFTKMFSTTVYISVREAK